MVRLQLRRKVRVEVVGIVCKAVGLEEAAQRNRGQRQRPRGVRPWGPVEKVGGTTKGECEVKWTPSF